MISFIAWPPWVWCGRWMPFFCAMSCSAIELLEGEAGGFLLGLLFGGALGFGEGAGVAGGVVDADFDAEALGVVGAGLIGEDVLGLAGSGGLEMLLKGGFVVSDGSAEGVAGVKGCVEIRECGLDDLFLDEAAGGGESAVEVEGGDDGFERVGEDGGFAASSAVLFATAEEDVVAEADAEGDVAEVTAADDGGAEAGELALAGVGEALEEGFGGEEAEDGVADEFELLVVGAGVGGGAGEGLVVAGGIGLVGEGTVGEGPDEELGAFEAMVQEGRLSWAGGGSSGLAWALGQFRSLRFTLSE